MNEKIKFYILGALAITTLLVPDMILHAGNLMEGTLTIVSKICLLCAGGLILLQFTKSFFWSYLLIGSFYLISSVPEIINSIALGWYMNTDGMKALYHTGESEIKEFINMFNFYLLIPVAVVIVFIVVLFQIKSFVYRRLKASVFVILLGSFIIISVSESILRLSKTASFYTDRNHVEYVFRSYYVEEHPFNLYYRIYHLSVLNKRHKVYNEHKSKFDFKIQHKVVSNRPDLIVFIIGESMRYQNWSLNGYNRNTSPQLDQMDNLLSFSKHFSNANSTSNSFPLLLTQASSEDFNEAFKQKTIVTLFKEAGYRTAWISSSCDVMEYLDNKNEPDEFYNLRELADIHTDEHIISTVGKLAYEQKAEPLLIVVNMRGAHDIPPPEFLQFEPNSSDETYALSTSNAQIFINDYDNLILFQDHILGGILDVLQSSELSSVMLFTSDHATHLFDEGHSKFGYGASQPTEIETHVPLFVWASEQYISDYSQKFICLTKHKDMLSTNNNLFYTLADMACINFNELQKRKSLSDSLFIEETSRFVYTNDGLFEFAK